MKFFKKQFSIFLCILLLASTLFAESAYALDSNGVTYDNEDGSLVISGSGAMLNTYKDDTTLTEVYILNGITSVPAEAFSGCTNLKKVVMYNSVTSMGDNAFKGCSSLSSLKLSRNIEAVGESAFEGCSSLTNIKLPESAVSVGKNAFKDCTALEYVIITQYVNSIGTDAFLNCTALANVYYAGLESDYRNVQKPEDLFGSAKIECVAPYLTLKKTYATNVASIRLSYVKGRFGSLDGQFILSGNATVSRIRFLRNSTYSSNSKDGRFAVLDTNNAVSAGFDVVTMTYAFQNCEDFSVRLIINSCTVMVESYDVNVPVNVKNQDIQFSHQYGEAVLDSTPSSETDGKAHKTCTCCGYEENIDLPAIFKNCDVSDNTAIIHKHQLSETAFRTNFLNYSFPVVTGAYGNFIGTGSTVKATYDCGITCDYDVAVRGDTDKDGLCDARDAVIIMCINEGLLEADSLEKCVKIAANANSDNEINESDSLFAIAKGVALQ